MEDICDVLVIIFIVVLIDKMHFYYAYDSYGDKTLTQIGYYECPNEFNKDIYSDEMDISLRVGLIVLFLIIRKIVFICNIYVWLIRLVLRTNI